MLRSLLLTLSLTGCLAAEIHWKCDPKDGKFVMAPCANCKKFYCWDGEIFSDQQGYTRPPSYVLSYWEEVHRKSQQIREDIDRRGKELKQQVEQAQQDTARLNRERMETHQEYMDDLKRRMAESRAPSAPRGTMTSPQGAVPRDVVNDSRPSYVRGSAISARAIPRDVVVDAGGPSTLGPSLPPISRTKVAGVQIGMNRAAVEQVIGKPHSAISIPDDDEGLVETLSYALDDRGTARVRIVQGKVTSVTVSD
jgi:hypothetical protein